MRRAIVILVAVAILGSLSFYVKDRQTEATEPKDHPSSSQASAGTSATSQQSNNSGSEPSASAQYKDGTFNGSTSDTPYGPVQVAAVVRGGKITGINFLQMPSDLPHSQEVTFVASPILKDETIQSQSANIDFVSGATSTSFGYEQSLQAALDQARLT